MTICVHNLGDRVVETPSLTMKPFFYYLNRWILGKAICAHTRIAQQQMSEPIPISEPFTWKEIYEASLKLIINKSPDNNGLQAEHLTYAPKCVHQDIANLLSEVAETGTYP